MTMEAVMDDLTMTRLCAEAMGYEFGETLGGNPHSWLVRVGKSEWSRYDPLHDDAQAMALLKRFDLSVGFQVNGHADEWVAQWFGDMLDDEIETHDPNLNRAIVICCAQMQQAKGKPPSPGR